MSDTTSTAYERWELPNVGPALGGGRRVPKAPMTAGEIESMQHQAYCEAEAQGRAAGYSEGYREGQQAAQQEVAQRLEQLCQIMSQLAEPLSVVDDEVEAGLTAVIAAVTKTVLARELTTTPGDILPIIRRALDVLPFNDRPLSLHLSPADADVVSEVRQANWSVVPDATVTAGGCRVIQGDCVVDATIEHRLDEALSRVWEQP